MKKILLDNESWNSMISYYGEIMLSKSVMLHNEFKVPETFDKLIYHYTCVDTFKAIVESQSFHSTNISYVNDSTELIYAQELIKRNILRLKEKCEDELEQIILDKLYEKFVKVEKSQRYISCFSIRGDLKSQWIDYGCNGEGVSIGFDAIRLGITLDVSTNRYHIIYDIKKQEKIIDYLLTNSLDFFAKRYHYFDWNGHDSYNLIAGGIFMYLLNFLCVFKDSKYSKEKEFRFEINLESPHNNYKRLNVNEKKVHGQKALYVINKTDHQKKLERKNKHSDSYNWTDMEFDYQLKKLPIVEVIIGCNLDFKQTKSELSDFLKVRRYEDVVFKKSKIKQI